jgi:hypothetical protein
MSLHVARRRERVHLRSAWRGEATPPKLWSSQPPLSPTNNTTHHDFTSNEQITRSSTTKIPLKPEPQCPQKQPP